MYTDAGLLAKPRCAYRSRRGIDAQDTAMECRRVSASSTAETFLWDAGTGRSRLRSIRMRLARCASAGSRVRGRIPTVALLGLRVSHGLSRCAACSSSISSSSLVQYGPPDLTWSIHRLAHVLLFTLFLETPSKGEAPLLHWRARLSDLSQWPVVLIDPLRRTEPSIAPVLVASR